MLLKKTRGRLPRSERARWPTVIVALLAVLVGLMGNILLDPLNVEVFATYYFFGVMAVALMFLRIEILKVGLFVSRAVVDKVMAANEWVRRTVYAKIEDISSREVVYFTKGDDISVLNRAALYVLKNEQTNRLKVVNVYQQEEEIRSDLASQLATIDHLYPQLKIDFLAVQGTFGPELIERLSQRLGVAKNAMFIGTPGDRFPHRVEDLGGVRIIL
jgi:glutaredoxin-related protein